ncbi:peptide chain release factor N(5)-glutamine methyltransferase [Paracoccus aurantiacus]|uniref:Release factor glutamine methyltransferase n=2 Tax=Paracoccus aurantiacus TaxID=2599412 RepID=A0A5C6RZ42_9RHOB|nr:peptide chain release factor N(5)-glutamine methyltransferase [Paracoccus aurantiacus]
MQLCLAAQTRFEAAGIDSAALDASTLFQHALHQALGNRVKHHHMAQHLMDRAEPDLIAAYEQLVSAREKRQPISQIIGRRAFWNHDFAVTGDTLDPRPDTETLIEAALKLGWRSVLDLGTGTGAILISLLAERPGATGMGTDLSASALAVARDNAARIGVEATFAAADWFDGVTGRFDLIVSNPPYIALSEMGGLQPEVRDWEPHSALTDFGDGLSAYRAIAADAAAHLTPGGHLLAEIGWQQANDVTAIFVSAGADVATLKDLNGHDRVIHAQFGGKST